VHSKLVPLRASNELPWQFDEEEVISVREVILQRLNDICGKGEETGEYMLGGINWAYDQRLCKKQQAGYSTKCKCRGRHFEHVQVLASNLVADCRHGYEHVVAGVRWKGMFQAVDGHGGQASFLEDNADATIKIVLGVASHDDDCSFVMVAG
jgi:hypothetical protein